MGSFVLQGTGTIFGRIVTYPTQLTATQIAEIYQSYTGYVVRPVAESAIVTIADNPCKVYANPWSIVSAG
jgi:hypothetical protein